MRLTTQDTLNLTTIISTCAAGGIDSIIIEDGLVRGINDSRSYVLISDFNVPKFPQKIGLSRISALKSRLDLFANGQDTIIDAQESDRGEISSLNISSGRNKAQFRCTSTMLIKAPKSINDNEARKIFLSQTEFKMVLNAIKVMGNKNVEITIKKDRSVSIGLLDVTNDAFSSALETPAEFLNDDTDSVVHYYDASIFYAVMKFNAEQNDTTALIIGEAGTIKSHVNGHSVVIMPKINEDSEEE